MKTAEAVLGNLAGLLWGNWMLFVLLGLGVFYTIATGCIQFRSIPWIIKEFCKKEDRTEPSRNHKGTVSSVQALYMAIASCVGSGNIVGVATALIGGGPGALFWIFRNGHQICGNRTGSGVPSKRRGRKLLRRSHVLY